MARIKLPRPQYAACHLFTEQRVRTPKHTEVVLRATPDVDGAAGNCRVQALVAIGTEFFTLVGADSRTSGYMLSYGALALRLPEFGPGSDLAAYFDDEPATEPVSESDTVEALIWDDWSACTYFVLGHAVLRLTAGGEVSLVAGCVDDEGLADGPGPAARFSLTAWQSLASDGAGSLYVSEGQRIRRIQLPEAWRSMEDGFAVSVAVGAAAATGALAEAGSAASPGAVVSTLPFTAPADLEALTWCPPAPPGEACSSYAAAGGIATAAVAHGDDDDNAGVSGSRADHSGAAAAPAGGWLVFTTRTALYRLPLPLPASAMTPPPPGLFDLTLNLHPQLLAGAEGQRGTADGRGAAARFDHADAIRADGAGNIYTMESWSRRVRRVSPDGCVSTLLSDVPEQFYQLVILPNGYMTLVSDRELRLIDLGLQPLLPRLFTPDAAQQLRSLPADLGALLDAQPDDSSDLTILVGERRFACHRAILAARCDYFKQRLAGDAFADGRVRELELPDADPDAFALLLRWLYTGGTNVPEGQARIVATLADRLLLPDLCVAAQAAIASSVRPDTVVDCLLWAWRYCESRGSGDASDTGDCEGGGAASSACEGDSGGVGAVSRAGASSVAGLRGCGSCGGFGALLRRLKRWYVAHHEEVAAAAGGSRARLAAEAPYLMVELMDAVLHARGAAGGGQQGGS